MSRHTWLLGCSVAVGLAIGVGNACLLTADPQYCTQDRDCDVGYVCDETGALPASDGHANTCVPVDTACSVQCAGTTPICGQDAVCRGCLDDKECPAGAPACRPDGSCGECNGNEDCDGDTPVCSPEGMCVEGMTCSNSDECPADQACGDDGLCGPCSEHAQCTSGLCDTGAGACVLAEDIVHVAESGADEDTCGGSDAPCQTIAYALATGTEWIAVAAGSYAETLQIEGGRRVSVIGAAGEAGEIAVTVTHSQTTVPILQISGADADVHVEGIAFDGDSGDAVVVQCLAAASLRLYHASVSKGETAGVAGSDGCDVTLERVLASANNGAGVLIDGGSFTLRNSVLAANTEVGLRRLNIAEGQRAVLEFNTIVGNTDGGLACEDSELFITGTHNILANDTTFANAEVGGCIELNGSSITTDFSIIRGRDMLPDFDSGDGYHLTGESLATSMGSADATGVTEDFDGEPRPNGARVDIGADEYYP